MTPRTLQLRTHSYPIRSHGVKASCGRDRRGAADQNPVSSMSMEKKYGYAGKARSGSGG